MLTSREFKVAGAIGPCSSLKKVSNNVAETAIGEGGKSVRVCVCFSKNVCVFSVRMCVCVFQ